MDPLSIHEELVEARPTSLGCPRWFSTGRVSVSLTISSTIKVIATTTGSHDQVLLGVWIVTLTGRQCVKTENKVLG